MVEYRAITEELTNEEDVSETEMRNLIRRIKYIRGRLSRVQMRIRTTATLMRSSDRVTYVCEPATLFNDGKTLICGDSSVWTLSAGKALLNEPRINNSGFHHNHMPFYEVNVNPNNWSIGLFPPSAFGQ